MWSKRSIFHNNTTTTDFFYSKNNSLFKEIIAIKSTMIFWLTIVIHRCWFKWGNLVSNVVTILLVAPKISNCIEGATKEDVTSPSEKRIDSQSLNDQKHDESEMIELEVRIDMTAGDTDDKQRERQVETTGVTVADKKVEQKVANCLIVDFSGVCAAQFCSDWLTLTDFCKFDSALCVTSIRKDFLTKIAQNKTVFSDRITDSKSTPQHRLFIWMRDHKVYARHFVLDLPFETYMKYNFSFSYYADSIFQHAESVQVKQGCSLRMVNFDSIRTILKIGAVHALSVYCGGVNLTESDLAKCIAPYQHLEQFTLQMEPGSSMNDSYLQLIAERFPKQTELYLRNSKEVTDKMLIKVAAACPALRRVDVRDSSITGVSLVRLVQYCGGLTDLRIAKCSKVSEELIVEIEQCCPSLTVLDVSHAALTETSLSCLLSFDHLNSLKMDNSGGFTIISTSATDRSSSNLTWLDISNTTLDGSTLKHMAKIYPNLRYMNAVNCGAQASDVLGGAAQHWHQLTYLDLSSGDRFTKDTSLYVGLEALIAANNFLFTLKVSCRANDAAVLAIAESACRDCLTWLDLSRCSSLTDTSIEALAAECSALAHLNLDKCAGLTDESLVCLAQGCPKLRWLSVKGCGKVSLKAIADVLEKCDKITTFHH